MKVLLLSDTSSEHTEKWALALANEGIKIGLFSFNRAAYEWYNHENITVFYEPEAEVNASSLLTKLAYIKYLPILKKIISHFKPDILHAHYASSYGFLAALSGFHPLAISVWGSDVYNFPSRSRFHKKIFQYNLKKADALLSTSHVMKAEIEKYTAKEIVVTPFGVDTEVFKNESPVFRGDTIHIGTIKPIEEKYGIVYIIDAAELLLKKFPDKKLLFHLVGSSSQMDFYTHKIAAKDLSRNFVVTGRIPFSEISAYHNKLDVFLNVSVDDSESFGVATVEAMACERPVVVTDAGGLKEVVNNGEFGIVVPKRNAGAIADAIEKFITDTDYAVALGKSARRNVLERYDWKSNLELMISIYKKSLKK